VQAVPEVGLSIGAQVVDGKIALGHARSVHVRQSERHAGTGMGWVVNSEQKQQQ
jgi:hypothetical protein